jgi:hypothetical protein
MWFDPGELAAYWRASRSVDEPPPVDPTRFETDGGCATLVCPRCSSETLVVRRIDVFRGGPCSACSGVWLSPSQSGGVLGGRAPDFGDTLVFDALEVAVELVFGVLDGL